MDNNINNPPHYYISGGGDHNTAHLYISSDIVEPSAYYPVYDLFRSCEPHQTIVMYLNSNGGQLQTLAQILSSMHDCEGHIIGCIDNECSSAATMLFLQCDSWKLTPFSKFMLHSDSGGYWGKRNEAISNFEFNRKWTDEFLTALYTPFLTPKEITEMLGGKDFYFDAEQIGVRLQKVVKEREKIHKKMQKMMVGL